MTFPTLKAGGWLTGERLASAVMNFLNTYIQSALDGADGGTYAPSAKLNVNGAGIASSVGPSTGNDLANKTYVDNGIYARYECYSLSGGSAVLGNDLNHSGFTVSSSTLLAVPSTGVYAVGWAVKAASTESSTANLGFDAQLYGDTSIYSNGEARRTTTSAAEGVWLSGFGIVPISNVVSEKIRLAVGANAGTASLQTETGAHMVIFKISS